MEDLLNPSLDRFMLFPIKHQDLFDFYKLGVSMFWTVEEVDLARDLEHWKNLSEGERHYLKFVLAFFAASDTLVNENLVLNFMREVQYPEARAYYTLQAFMETIHSEMYGLLINTYIQNEEERNKLFNAIRTIPAVAEKAEFCFRWFDNEKDFASRLVAFSCVEGIFFSASFASIFFFKSKGVLPGLTVSNDYISRDEASHTTFALMLYQKLKHRLDESQIHEIYKEAVELEKRFVNDSLPTDLIGMNKKLMCQYVEFVADQQLRQFGYNPIYNAEQPFEFMQAQGLAVKANFFEGRVTAYAKEAVSSEVVFDADF